jgi:lipopolysaccharide export system protein LptA
MRRALRTAAGCALAALALGGAPARAERADKDREANVTADHSTLDDLHQVEVLTGHVVLIKGTMRLGGERMEHRQDERGYQYYVVTAAPDDLATFHERRDPVRPGVESTLDGVAERIEYDDKDDRVTLTRRAVVKRFDNGELRDELGGERIVYDARKSNYEVDGHTVEGEKGRVVIRIAPRGSGPAPATPAPATPAPAPAGAAPKTGAAAPPAAPSAASAATLQTDRSVPEVRH